MRSGGWRGAMTVVGAVMIVAALSLLTVSALTAFDGDDDRQTVGLGLEEPDGADAGRTTTTRRSTTTTTAPRTTTTQEAPEVLGEVTTRETGDDADGEAPTTVAPASTTAPRPATTNPPTTAAPAPPPTAPPTTVCRNSTDPSCGPLEWDPAPAATDPEVFRVSVPERVIVGQEVTFAVDVVERAGGDAIGACASWTVDAPGIPNVSTCEAVNHSCDRYGPHDPPAPSDDRVRLTRTVTFDEPGRYEVTAGGHTATHLADGCASPYLASWERTYVVVVDPP